MGHFDFIKEGYGKGDKVFTYQNGWGVIKSVNVSLYYPISVQFPNGSQTFTVDGKGYESDLNPTLFRNEFQVPDVANTKPRHDLKVDDPILVLFGGGRFRRHFAGWDEYGCIQTFQDGKTSWSSQEGEEPNSWEDWQLPVEEAGDGTI